MYEILLPIHSYLRYAVLILLVLVVLKSLAGWLGKTSYEKLDGQLALFNLIFAHIQLILGLLLYVVSPLVMFEGGVMGNKIARYWTVEHISMMIIAIVLITLARSLSKRKTDDAAKHKTVFIFNALALLIIVVAILQSGRGLF
jgi:phosphoglycerol transferase MdoB-like AlkP superfamily enzyme